MLTMSPLKISRKGKARGFVFQGWLGDVDRLNEALIAFDTSSTLVFRLMRATIHVQFNYSATALAAASAESSNPL